MEGGEGMKPYHFNAKQKIFDFAKSLRKEQTCAEEILWKALRNGQLGGCKFRRQHPMGRYIPDFYCHAARLCIEVDGSIHNLKAVKEHDENRQQAIESCGITVMRVTNKEVITELDNVLKKIKDELDKKGE